MNRTPLIFCWIAVAVLPVLLSPARATDFGDVSVNSDSVTNGNPGHGYTEFSFVISNRSLSEEHRVRLSLPKAGYRFYGNYLKEISRTVRLAPVSTVRVSLLQPPLPVTGDGVEVAIDGRTQDDTVPLARSAAGGPGRARSARAYSPYGAPSAEPNLACILVSRNVDKDIQDNADKVLGIPTATMGGMMMGAPPGGPGTPMIVPPVGPPPGPGGSTAPPSSGGGAGGGPAPTPPGKSRTPSRPGSSPMPVTPAPMMTPSAGFGMPGGPGMRSSTQFIRADLDVELWSTNWLGFSSYDAVIVTADDLRKMPAGIRTALYAYAECGGVLAIIGKPEIPESWRNAKEATPVRQRERAAPPGGPSSSGPPATIPAQPPKLADILASVVQGRSIATDFSVYNAGFGQCMIVPEPTSARWSTTLWRYLRDACDKAGTPWQNIRDIAKANQEFEVVENLGIPVPGLIGLMIFFAVMVGPVNLTVLGRLKRKVWLLWTVPVFSVLMCVAVFAYATFAEGWGGHAKTEGITILDEAEHRATSIGWTGFYTPLTPGDGLRFSYDTEITPQVADAARSGPRRSISAGNARTVDWTDDQHLNSGWVTARVPAHFMLRKSETRRERLNLRADANGKFAVVNGLGAEIRELWLADKNGNVYTAVNIPAGEQVALRPTGEKADAPPDRMRQDYVMNWVTSIKTFEKTPTSRLRPGCYVAVLEQNPFLEHGLGRASDQRAQAFVVGIMSDKKDGE